MSTFINEDTDSDVQKILRVTDNQSPEIAVKNIQRAEHLDLHADDYTSMKDELEPEVKIQERVPATVSKPVKDYMSQSSEHAASIQDEIGIFDKIGKQISFIKYNLIDKREVEGSIQDLQSKKRRSGLQDHEEEFLSYLKTERQERVDSFGLTENEQLIGEAAGVMGDMVETLIDNKETIAASTAFGAGVGLVAPIPAGAVAGAATGFGAATSTFMILRAYEKTADSTFDEISSMKGDDGKPLDLSRDQMDRISIGVGVAAGMGEALTAGALGAGLKKLAGKTLAEKVVKNTTLKTATTLLGNVLQSAGISASEEMAAEVVQIAGENYAKSDQSIEGFANALTLTANQIANDPKIQKRIGRTGAVGGLAGGGSAAVSGLVVAPKFKRALDKRNSEIIEIQEQREQFQAITDALTALETQTDMLNVANMSIQTNLKKLSPEQVTSLRRDMFSEAGFQDKVWFTENDIQALAESNPELAAKIKEMDVTESDSAGAGLELHQFMDLVDEVPTVSDWARLNPEAPNPLESREVLKRFNEAESKRAEFLNSLGPGEQLSPQQIEELDALSKEVRESTKRTGEIGYIEDTITFTQKIKEVLPDKQVEKYDATQKKVRGEVSKLMNEEFENREQRTENKVVRLNEKLIKQRQEEEFAEVNRIVELFKPNKEVVVAKHAKKGYSQFAIDPATLPEDMREVYVTDPMLQKRKVFVEGGITLEEAASRSGMPDGESLLRVLANAPTKQEFLTARRLETEELRSQVRESRAERMEQRRDKVFDDYNKLHRREMEILKDNEWSTVKQGVKKIALPLPRIEELNNTARVKVKNTKVAHVNPRQFNKAEKDYNRKAVNHILKNEVEQAFVAKERAMQNVELTRESLKARAKINDAKQFLKRVTSKKGMKVFKQAGLTTQVNEILDLFDLTSPSPKATRRDAYIDFLQQLDSRGESIVANEALADTRKTGTDLTVEQYLNITDRLRTLEKQAKLKNKLLRVQDKRAKEGKLQTEEAIVTDAVLNLQEHPNYKESRLQQVRNKNSKDITQRINENVALAGSFLTNFKNVVTELDQENLSGEHYQNLVVPMTEAETSKRSKNFALIKQIKKIAAQYGEKDFAAAFNEFVTIPEFNNIAELGNGKMSKSDLWMLFAYLGDPQARERMQNFINPVTGEALNADVVAKVLEQHLDHKDAKLSQNFINIFKSFEEESIALHERTTGVTPTMVKGVPIEFKGRVYEGGYVPLNYLNTNPTEKLNRFLDMMGDKKLSMFGEKQDNKLYGRLRAAEQTEQGRLMDRLGSSRALDTDFKQLLHAFEETIHDLSYREAGTDVLKLLRNGAYSNAIIATVGEAKYKTMTAGVIETVGNSHDQDALNPFSDAARSADTVYKFLVNNFSVANLGFKFSSVAMQPVSLGAAALRMGPKGGRYIAKSIGAILSNLDNYNEMFNMAAEINPDLIFNQDSIDDTVIKSSYEFIPETKRTGKQSKKMAWLKNSKQKMVDAAMWGLTKLDIQIKAAVTLASYSQFMNGDVKAFPQEKLDTMTEAEKQLEAKRYAKQIADLALTTSAKIDKSAIEKVSLMRVFTAFYTDSRAQLNTAMSEGRKVRLSLQKAKQAEKIGDTKQYYKNTKDAAATIGSFIMIQGLTQLYISSIRGEDDSPIKELAKVNDLNDLKKFFGNTVGTFALAPAKSVIDVTPVARDFQFAIGGFRRKKEVRLPINAVFSDMATFVSALADFLQGDRLSKQQRKSLFATASYLGGGFPIRGPQEILQTIHNTGLPGAVGGFLGREADRLANEIRLFKERHGDNPDMQEDIEALEELQRDLAPNADQTHLLPEDILDTFKINDWQDVDPNTGAAGVYQFTEQRWEEIDDADPSLGLTDNGRVSKDTREQEKAMKWSLEDNAKRLSSFQIEPSTANLYGAHRFGANDYIAVLLSDNDNQKLTEIVENANLFIGFETVKDVKNHITNQVKKIDSKKD